MRNCGQESVSAVHVGGFRFHLGLYDQSSRLVLPPESTKVIIAHCLNTIDNVDQIFFVNSGEVTLAGSMEHAVDLLLHERRSS